MAAQMSNRMAQASLAVLQPDWAVCGDSEGDFAGHQLAGLAGRHCRYGRTGCSSNTLINR